VEQGWHDSTLVPFDSTRYSVIWSQHLTTGYTGTLTASYAQVDYYGEHDLVQDTNVAASLTKQISPRLSLTGRIAWINDHDKPFGNTDGLEEQVEADWHYRQTDFYARFRNAYLNSTVTRDGFQTVEVGLKRSF
jgi:hypothetical protein